MRNKFPAFSSKYPLIDDWKQKMTQIGQIENLYRYPVKGLAGEPTEQLTLSRDLGVLGDRALALTRQTGIFNASAEKPLYNCC